MKFKVYKFNMVTSTNDEAINLIREKRKESGYVFATSQTRGRGTKGRKWISHKGNLFGSIFFPLKNEFPPFTEFAIINPIIISEVIKHYCKKKITLKFPNDVLVNKKKICGILQEIITLKNQKFLIIGIGINLVSSPILDNKYLTTNIFSETKKKPNIKEIISLIISSYENFFAKLKYYNYDSFKNKANKMALN
tara:strand:+ start:315 stop:896 length:582 start_codon:yes stop_codon:yes gene_type:complete